MVLFLLGLMACPFIFSSCEEDHGETDYNNVTDDDWKKKTIVSVDNAGDELPIVDYSSISDN